jgi:predicted PurR-regulated permease PerM
MNIKELSLLIPVYQKNIVNITNSINNDLNIDLINMTKQFLGDFEYGKILSTLLNSLTEVFGKAVLIIIYTLFLLLEEPFFSPKIKAIYEKRSNHKDIHRILNSIDRSIGRYISIKTLTSLITGISSYIALVFIGIDAPLFWAFLIFIMNFIPTIGSLFATIFPSIFAILQFGEIMPGIWVLTIVGTIQLIIGNYIDPKITGDSLNVSPLVVILGLSFWGAIWGVIGMILSVPISVMLINIFAQIPATRSISIMLSIY